jgi:hypothetical protein
VNDGELDALLARGGLSGAARERVLENVLDRVSPEKRSVRRLAVAIALPAAAAMALFVAGSGTLGKWRGQDAAFGARGGKSASVRVDAVCTGGPMEACPRGSRLIFHASPDTRPGYLAAYADPVGGGERIWYFSADGESPHLGADSVDRAVVVGAEHVAARYKVHLLVGTRPLTRPEALVGSDPAVIGADTIELGPVP